MPLNGDLTDLQIIVVVCFDAADFVSGRVCYRLVTWSADD